MQCILASSTTVVYKSVSYRTALGLRSLILCVRIAEAFGSAITLLCGSYLCAANGVQFMRTVASMSKAHGMRDQDHPLPELLLPSVETRRGARECLDVWRSPLYDTLQKRREQPAVATGLPTRHPAFARRPVGKAILQRSSSPACSGFAMQWFQLASAHYYCCWIWFDHHHHLFVQADLVLYNSTTFHYYSTCTCRVREPVYLAFCPAWPGHNTAAALPQQHLRLRQLVAQVVPLSACGACWMVYLFVSE